MTVKPMGRRALNRVARHSQLMAAATEIFEESGLAGLTMQAVAERVDCAVGTIYTYFPDGRDQLVRDAYQRTADIVSADGAIQRDQQGSTTDRIMSVMV